MVTTVAPTMPVLAASMAPTITTDTPSPPGLRPNSRAMLVSKSSAIRALSSTFPIKINKGTAMRVSLPMVPNIRAGSAVK